ncbi:DUF72 domain-containing protein [Geomonas sp. Red69]|uniref:DUF72 domain-containing protein n=1 Tax=Geomonas diazotrophica TaxID=2843197 RepID=A0ABX8JS43_9BACT|nr:MULTISPECIES: DUF72 domain-containing protein [Geomonas]MBU5637101.1 DUF72 domain-containing protein [Geomonas diazotrophica]QWV99402.1 DUF72 domain-containing protein [Geomonas nitrogeniifigens]
MAPGKIRIGTCSWTESSLIESGTFYPRGAGTPKARLKFYARQFDTVEIESSYYQIPSVEMAQAWTERTPPGFLFHVKAFGALTGHNIDPRRLPAELQALLAPGELDREELHVAEPGMLKAMAQALLDALEPLRQARKMGFTIFQFPPWFGYKKANLDYLRYCKELMAGIPIAVEFRHGSWFTAHHRDELFAFLKEHKITYITCDEPQYGNLSTAPFHPEATTGIAYLRLHGRNGDCWHSDVPGDEYLYPEAELQEIARHALRLSETARTTFIMFNNCRCGYAVKNALEMREHCRVVPPPQAPSPSGRGWPKAG